MWGVTACDGPTGYQAGRTDIISPLAIYTVAPLIPEATPYLKSLKVSPETPAYQPSTGWTSSDRIGIDDTCCVIMRYRYGRKIRQVGPGTSKEFAASSAPSL
jgi:hypothetical protein